MTDPIELLKAYIQHPSVSTDPAFSEGMLASRSFVTNLLQQLDFSVETIETDLHPILLAERLGDPDWPHIVLYAHYDVQPADPYELWQSPPFEPEVRDGRLYGRGAADNKGPTIVHLAALAQVLEANPDLPLNISYVVEGEEEIGSPSMPKFFAEYGARLAKADYLLVSDTGSPNTEQIVVTTALRGLVDLEVELKGPSQDLHSGVHGGAVYNPLRALMEIAASLHNADGSVNVPGFYEAVTEVEDWERAELARYPETEASYQKLLGVPAFAKAPNLDPLEAVRFGPTLEFNGIGGGYQGEGSKTVIPSRAFAKITCRLVAHQDSLAIQETLCRAIEQRCPAAVKLSIRRGAYADAYQVSPPHKSPHDSAASPRLRKAFAAVDAAIESAFGKAPLYLREGGSIPVIADFKKQAGLDAIMVGLFTPKDNLHAPDESFDLALMQRGITAFASIFQQIAQQA